MYYYYYYLVKFCPDLATFNQTVSIFQNVCVNLFRCFSPGLAKNFIFRKCNNTKIYLLKLQNSQRRECLAEEMERTLPETNGEIPDNFGEKRKVCSAAQTVELNSVCSDCDCCSIIILCVWELTYRMF